MQLMMTGCPLKGGIVGEDPFCGGSALLLFDSAGAMASCNHIPQLMCFHIKTNRKIGWQSWQKLTLLIGASGDRSMLWLYHNYSDSCEIITKDVSK